MKIPQDIVDQIIGGNLEEVYNIFITLEGEYPNYEKDYEKVRFGTNIKFDIYHLLKKTMNIDIREKEGKVIIGARTYGIEEMWTEEEERRRIMVEAIIKNTLAEETITPR